MGIHGRGIPPISIEQAPEIWRKPRKELSRATAKINFHREKGESSYFPSPTPDLKKLMAGHGVNFYPKLLNSRDESISIRRTFLYFAQLCTVGRGSSPQRRKLKIHLSKFRWRPLCPVHLWVTRYTKAAAPKTSFEILYWVSEKYPQQVGHSTTNWIHLAEESHFVAASLSVGVDSESSGLYLDITQKKSSPERH